MGIPVGQSELVYNWLRETPQMNLVPFVAISEWDIHYMLDTKKREPLLWLLFSKTPVLQPRNSFSKSKGITKSSTLWALLNLTALEVPSVETSRCSPFHPLDPMEPALPWTASEALGTWEALAWMGMPWTEQLDSWVLFFFWRVVIRTLLAKLDRWWQATDFYF